MKQKASGTEIILTVMTRKGIANSLQFLLSSRPQHKRLLQFS